MKNNLYNSYISYGQSEYNINVYVFKHCLERHFELKSFDSLHHFINNINFESGNK